ncbi:MAG: putative transposase [Mycobacterium sp.]|nr:putative transposase [Mycobacterium sp.]
MIRSHFGARRKAFNWGLAQVKTDLAARQADPQHVSVGWDLASLRWAWNRAKDKVAPWWAENSKEAYSSGLADLARALDNWHASKTGTRAGRRVGFPRFTSARHDPGLVRFSTGAMRLDADRRTITLPVIGRLRSMENTRRVQRHVAGGRARILNMTLSQRWGRLFISVGYALRTPTTPRAAARPTTRAGVDLGMRTLATVAAINTATGEETLTEYPNPAPLKATLTARRHHGCHQTDPTACRLVGKHRMDKQLVCPHTGQIVDRDHNAARNLRDWPDKPVDAQSVRRPRPSAGPAVVPQTAAQTVDPINGLRSSHKTTRRAAVNGEDRTGSAQPAVKEPRKRSAWMITNDHSGATVRRRT